MSISRVEYTKTNMANLALSQLGSERLQVNDITTDTSIIADAINDFYVPTLEEVTSMSAWNCCIKSIRLMGVSEGRDTDVFDSEIDVITTAPSFHMSNAYQLPADAIRVYYASASSGHNFKGSGLDFEVNGRILNVNAADPYIIYTAVPENDEHASSKDYTSMDSLFARCFYTLLAARTCVRITGSSELESALLDEFYNICLPDAMRCDAIEGVNVLKHGEDNREVRVNQYTTFEKV